MFTGSIFEIWGSYRIEIGQNFRGYPHAEFQRSLETSQNSKEGIQKGEGSTDEGPELRKFDYTSLVPSISFCGAVAVAGMHYWEASRAFRIRPLFLNDFSYSGTTLGF